MQINKLSLAEIIIEHICRTVNEENKKVGTNFGEPLIGFVNAGEPGIAKLQEVAHPNHLKPEDILPGAKTVIVYFLPFTKEVALDNQPGIPTTRVWAVAYQEANSLLTKVGEKLLDKLTEQGIQGAGVKPTHNFCEQTLLAGWSHRHLAWLAGLGQFGLNRMLITAKGCAGRYGSVVIDQEVYHKINLLQERDFSNQEAEQSQEHPCLYFRQGSCRVCVKNCPSGALTTTGFDRHRCYAYMLDHCRDLFSDLGVTDVCGKCLATPCAVR